MSTELFASESQKLSAPLVFSLICRLGASWPLLPSKQGTQTRQQGQLPHVMSPVSIYKSNAAKESAQCQRQRISLDISHAAIISQGIGVLATLVENRMYDELAFSRRIKHTAL